MSCSVYVFQAGDRTRENPPLRLLWKRSGVCTNEVLVWHLISLSGNESLC
jgi:hypothetical protein